MLPESEIENSSILDSTGAASGLTEASSTALVRRSPRKFKTNTSKKISKNIDEDLCVESSIEGDDLDDNCSPNINDDISDEEIK